MQSSTINKCNFCMGDLGGYGIADQPPAGPHFRPRALRALGRKWEPLGGWSAIPFLPLSPMQKLPIFVWNQRFIMPMSLWVHFGASGAYKCDFSTSFRKRKIEKKILSWLDLNTQSPRERQLCYPPHHEGLAIQTTGFLQGQDLLLYDLLLADH